MSQPLFDIRFVAHKNGIKGEHANFNKIIFVAYQYCNTSPGPGEVWRCAIICDTRPEDTRRGAILVRPLARLVTPARPSICQAKASVLPNAKQLEIIKANLRGAQAVKIAAVERSIKSVTAVATNDRYKNYIVHIDQQAVGLFDSWSDLKVADLPMQVECIKLTLDCGTVITVHDRTIPIISHWYQRPYKRRGHSNWHPVKSRLLTSQPLPKFGGKCFAWDEVIDKKAGDVLFYEYPFQWQLNWLTNGIYSFPREVPRRQQWQALPVKAMPPQCWQLFLQALEGKMLDQMQAQYQSVVAKQPHTKENKQARTIVPEGQDAGNKSYQLWQGEISCKQISIGQNLVFTVSRVPLGPLYVVDNAGVGALYVFESEQDARALACGKNSRRQAQKLCLLRLVHRPGWQQKLAVYLTDQINRS